MDSNNFITLSDEPEFQSRPILKPTASVENLIVMQTPVHKNLKVSFQTPRAQRNFGSPYFKSGLPSQNMDSSGVEEELKWRERMEVVTKYDHEEYTTFAKEFLDDIIDKVVQRAGYSTSIDNKNRENSKTNSLENQYHLKHNDKVKSSIVNHNLINPFVNTNSLPPVAEEQDTVINGNVVQIDDDQFHDAVELVNEGFDFNLDYLESKGGENLDLNLRKQSLYLKFDPLVSKEEPTVLPRIGRKSDIIDFNGHNILGQFPTPIFEEPTKQPDFLCDSPSKFTSSTVVRENSVDPPSRTSTESEFDIIDVLKYTEADMQKRLIDSTAPLEKQNANLAVKVVKQEEEIGQLEVVIQAFEETTLRLAAIQKKETLEHEELRDNLLKDNEQLKSHLESVEKAYFELLQRSKVMKQASINWKANENAYKKAIQEYQTCVESEQQRYKALKVTMEEMIQKLNDEHAQKEDENKAQLTAAKAKWKCLESQVKSLQLHMEQKTKENVELTKICDELIDQQAGIKS